MDAIDSQSRRSRKQSSKLLSPAGRRWNVETAVVRASGARELRRVSRLSAAGDLRDPEALQRLYWRGSTLIASQPGRAILHLSEVVEADTKLVAILLVLVRLARAARVPLSVSASTKLRAWIEVCRVGHLLRPHLVGPSEETEAVGSTGGRDCRASSGTTTLRVA